MLLRVLLVGMLLYSAPASAEVWSWRWSADDPPGQVAASVEPFLYGKTWAYALEVDDGPATTLSVVQPLLAQQVFTDAPPGLAGGQRLPFVGGAAVNPSRLDKGNSHNLGWDDLRKLQSAGWGVINHSYFHAGRTFGNPPELLTADQMRNDLFWSQTLLGLELGDGRAPVHFVYPNGYTDYGKHLAEFGLLSGSRVSGSNTADIYSEKMDFADLGRHYLDEGYWTRNGRDEPMLFYPDGGPRRGAVFIDFTHGINKDPNSANHQRWIKRLNTIGSTHGAAGRDDVWSAPTGDIIAYVNAARRAQVGSDSNVLRVSIPDDLPGTRLTIRLQNVPADANLAPAPDGAVVYRRGSDVFITTPMLNAPGAPLPEPRVQRIYSGDVKSVDFEKPVKISAVRLLQSGRAPAGFKLAIDAHTPDGKIESLLSPDAVTLTDNWNYWRLYSTVPTRDAILARRLEVTPLDKVLHQMEIWIIP